jgi:very-short-patch-repair endonuclease
MGWGKWKVAVEYNGPQHWTDPKRHARDIDRLAELQAEGWIIIRVSRNILRYRPDEFLVRVREAMRVAGWPYCDEIRLGARLQD